jgi:hypothetical protein
MTHGIPNLKLDGCVIERHCLCQERSCHPQYGRQDSRHAQGSEDTMERECERKLGTVDDTKARMIALAMCLNSG